MDNKYSYYVTEDCDDSRLLKYWNKVCKNIKETSFVQRNEWFNAYLKSNLKSSSYYCFIVFLRNEKPVAVIPLQRHITNRFGFTFIAWQILSPNELCLNDLVFISTEANTNIFDHLIEYLNSRQDLPWDLLELKYCRQGGSVDVAISLKKPPRSVTIIDNSSKYLLCKSGIDNSIEKRSSKFKRNIRRLWKKIRQKGEITTHLYKDPSQLDEAFNEFLEVESSGWKGESKTALIHDKRLQSFYRSILETFGRNGACIIHTMKLNGRPIASQFSVIAGETYNMLKIGYDEEFKSESPGALLIDETVRVFSNDNNINTISFVTGSSWSDKWLPENLYVANHYIYNKTIKGNACYFFEKGKNYLRLLKNNIKQQRR